MIKATWNVTDNFGQSSKVRLTEEGKLEKRKHGGNGWQPVIDEIVDLSIYTVKDVRDLLRGMEGIAKVVRKKV